MTTRSPWRRQDLAPVIRLWDNDFHYSGHLEQPQQLEPWPRWFRRVAREAWHQFIPHWALFLLTIGVIVCGILALYFAGPAWSQGPVIADYADVYDDAICATLDEYPTIPGVLAVLDVVAEDSGLSYYDTGTVVAVAVNMSCPRHMALLQRFAAVYAPKRVIA